MRFDQLAEHTFAYPLLLGAVGVLGVREIILSMWYSFLALLHHSADSMSLNGFEMDRRVTEFRLGKSYP